jgi:hypothetical protein
MKGNTCKTGQILQGCEGWFKNISLLLQKEVPWTVVVTAAQCSAVIWCWPLPPELFLVSQLMTKYLFVPRLLWVFKLSPPFDSAQTFSLYPPAASESHHSVITANILLNSVQTTEEEYR